MEAGDEGKALVDLADRLCDAFGYPTGGAVPDGVEPREHDWDTLPFGTPLSRKDERLVAIARRSLAQLVIALEARHGRPLSTTTSAAQLAGAEMSMRSKIATDHRISKLMPDLVFLVALPFVTQDVALQLSRRAASLLEEEIGELG